MINKMNAVTEDIAIGYKIALDKLEVAERAYAYAESMAEKYIDKEAIWDKALDKAYDKMVIARKCFESYGDALECARKLYSILQDIEEYKKEMRR